MKDNINTEFEDDLIDSPESAPEEFLPQDKTTFKQHAEYDSIQYYFQEISRIQVLNAEDELKLAKQAQAGNIMAREKMINCNLRLVVSVAKRYMHCGLPLADIIEEGNLGLIKAVDKFKPEMGFRFSTYATWWIRQSMVRALAKNTRTIRLPINVVERLNRFVRVLRNMVHKFGRIPTSPEIAEEMSLPPEQIANILQMIQPPASLETEIGCKDGNSLKDVLEDKSIISPIEATALKHRKENINLLLSLLTDQEQDIIKLRFGLEDTEPQTLDAIGITFGLTRERIRQIEGSALKKLRRFLFRQQVNLSELL